MSNSGNPKIVAVIGLGNMGTALAEALLAAGFPVTVWNRTADKCSTAGEKGAEVASSPAQALSAAEVVILCVSDHMASKEILFNDDLARLLSNKLLVQLSSINSAQSREMNDWASGFQIDYIEGSIFGLPIDIRESSAILAYAGRRSVFDEHEAVFSALGGNPKFIGEVIGSAVTIDKIVYACGYAMMQGYIQAAAMAHASDVSIAAFTEILLARLPTWSQMLSRQGEAIVKRDHDLVDCRLDVHAAAFAGTLALCHETGVDSSLPSAMMHNFDRAIEDGHGGQELTALFESLIPKI